MRALLPILFIGMLPFVTLQAQVPYDLTNTRDYWGLWFVVLGATPEPPTYFPDFCGLPGNHKILVTSASFGGFWKMNPRFTTDDGGERWSGVDARPIDYDGVPPMEYINGGGGIYRCDGGRMVAIDAIDATCTGGSLKPSNTTIGADIDGDGYQDIVCNPGKAGFTAHVVMGGPGWGSGCGRIRTLPRVRSREMVATRAFYRSAAGGWRVVQHERDSDDPSSWMMIYDIDVTRDGDTLTATFTKLDSLLGGVSTDVEPLGNVEMMVDTVAGRDYLLVQRIVDFSSFLTAVERFDVTDGHFVSTGEKVTGLFFVDSRNLGYELGTDRPVIAINSPSGILFCYGDNIREPFGRWDPRSDGAQSVSGWTVVNDQTGDGKRDIVMGWNTGIHGSLHLISLDRRVSVERVPQLPDSDLTATLDGDVLVVTRSIPSPLSVDLTTIDGRTIPVSIPAYGMAGQIRYDLASVFSSVPAGVYYLRICAGDASRTIPVIR